MAIILNLVGIIFILLSLIFINRMSNDEKEIYESILVLHKDVKYYSETVENMIVSFDSLIETSLVKLDKLDSRHSKESEEIKLIDANSNENMNKMPGMSNSINKSKKDDTDTKGISKRIIQLKREGLSNEEIAKILNKSVREIEVITKIWSNVYGENLIRRVKD